MGRKNRDGFAKRTMHDKTRETGPVCPSRLFHSLVLAEMDGIEEDVVGRGAKRTIPVHFLFIF